MIGLWRRGREIWRHLKRGTCYEMLGTAELQLSSHHKLPLSHIAEGAVFVVYRSIDDGKLYLRIPTEFYDGRFEMAKESHRADDCLTREQRLEKYRDTR